MLWIKQRTTRSSPTEEGESGATKIDQIIGQASLATEAAILM